MQDKSWDERDGEVRLDEQARTKPITIYDIAKEAGVSSATVSRAISGKGYISENKKLQILDLVEKYNFRPNTFAQNLKSGFTKTIGFIVPHIGNMYFASVYYEFEKWASSHGYMTILLNSKGDYEVESKLLYSLKEKRVDGIVMMGGRMDAVELSDDYIREISEIKDLIPFVSCAAKSERFGCASVYTDDGKGVELLMTHLKSKGYNSFYMIGGGDEFYPAYLKKKYALEIGKKLDMKVNVNWLTPGMHFDYRAGYNGMKMLLEKPLEADVICGVNDYVAVGARDAALEAGLRVPEDIAFVGFDDIGIGTVLPTHITSVSPCYDIFGKKVFTSLHKIMQDNKPQDMKTTLIRPELKLHESTK